MDFNDVSYYKLNKDIKKESTSLRNRLQSIILDHDFIKNKVAPYFPDFPLIPNERCGVWYCSPDEFEQTSYFKSTDGHVNQWDFSTRRLNFHLLDTIEKYKGIVIIDSTRRGKKIPDALSKTVPIWCAVLNTLILEAQGKKSQESLYLPPSTISKSEVESIRHRIPELATKLKELNVITGKSLVSKFSGKILRPIWIHPKSSILFSTNDIFTGESTESHWETPADANFLPVVLCTASYQVQDGIDRRDGFLYVQGAADDHELWSNGLTAELLWQNIEYFRDITKSDNELQNYITERLLSRSVEDILLHENNLLDKTDKITNEIILGRLSDACTTINKDTLQYLAERYSGVVILSGHLETFKPDTLDPLHDFYQNHLRIYKLQSGSKRSSRDLRSRLPDIHKFSTCHVSEEKALPLLVCCNSGTDMSIAVLLVLLCKHYSLNWDRNEAQLPVDKLTVRKHLIKLIEKLNGRNVNPSRATLNSVNSYLMGFT